MLLQIPFAQTVTGYNRLQFDPLASSLATHKSRVIDTLYIFAFLRFHLFIQKETCDLWKKNLFGEKQYRNQEVKRLPSTLSYNSTAEDNENSIFLQVLRCVEINVLPES